MQRAAMADAASPVKQDWAQAHDKAVQQLVADRVEALHQRVVRRERARAAASSGDESA
jgi:hypothetical protein